MVPIAPPAREGAVYVVFAKDQPEYIPLPANISADGSVETEWELSTEERAAIASGANLRLFVLTHFNALQPLRLEVVGVES